MQRIVELASDYLRGRTSAKVFRSALIAQLSMLSDETTKDLAKWIVGWH